MKKLTRYAWTATGMRETLDPGIAGSPGSPIELLRKAIAEAEGRSDE